MKNMNNSIYNMYIDHPTLKPTPLQAGVDGIILCARRKQGIYSLQDIKESLKDISVNIVSNDGHDLLELSCTESGTSNEISVKITDSTLRLILSLLSNMHNDSQLDWKLLMLSENMDDMNNSVLFKHYYEPITSILEPNTIFIMFEAAVIVAILLTYYPEQCENIYQVAQVSGITIDEERLPHIIFALRTLIVSNYRALYVY